MTHYDVGDEIVVQRSCPLVIAWDCEGVVVAQRGDHLFVMLHAPKVVYDGQDWKMIFTTQPFKLRVEDVDALQLTEEGE